MPAESPTVPGESQLQPVTTLTTLRYSASRTHFAA